MYVVSIDAPSKTELILLGRHETIPHVKSARALRRLLVVGVHFTCNKLLRPLVLCPGGIFEKTPSQIYLVFYGASFDITYFLFVLCTCHTPQHLSLPPTPSYVDIRASDH